MRFKKEYYLLNCVLLALLLKGSFEVIVYNQLKSNSEQYYVDCGSLRLILGTMTPGRIPNCMFCLKGY
jgi:hypothetical protein